MDKQRWGSLKRRDLAAETWARHRATERVTAPPGGQPPPQLHPFPVAAGAGSAEERIRQNVLGCLEKAVADIGDAVVDEADGARPSSSASVSIVARYCSA